MNEFDLRKFLSKNPLLNKEEITENVSTEKVVTEETVEEVTEETVAEETVAEETVEEVTEETVEEVNESPKLTKESLRNLIKEKITTLLAEVEEVNEAEEDEEAEEAEEAEPADDIEIPADDSIEDESTDIEVGDGEENEVITLFSQAKEEIAGLGADEETKAKMMRQINNTITMFARDYLAKEEK